MICFLNNEAVTRAKREVQMELEGLYRAKLERVSQASYRQGYKEAKPFLKCASIQ